ncbi:hypothetical protein [Flavobacterium sp.]|uniref:hypothetical protein n=1 Tax=Flavobacterium sp. TaxID=239 RepID=UPI0025BEE9D7|nr:hypothetical protein [Flavobacterium sp.]
METAKTFICVSNYFKGTGHYFRDKLVMRMKAKSCGISNPNFCSLFNDHDINTFADKILPPWVLKPRSEASATEIIKLNV